MGFTAFRTSGVAFLSGAALGYLGTRAYRNNRLCESAEPVVAYMNHSRWLVDCQCGSGCRIDMDIRGRVFARCFKCGAVHSDVVLPGERASIEGELLKRPRPENRNWTPGETVTDMPRGTT